MTTHIEPHFTTEGVEVTPRTVIRRKCFAYFLMLLVFSAMTDDTWAAATSDTDDEIVAAENNQYLHAPYRRLYARLCDLNLAQSAVLDTVAAGVALPGIGRWDGDDADSANPSGPQLLYLLMSMQC